MTQRVVHLLEAVEVQIGDQRLVLPAVLPTRKRLGETLDEHAAVRQAGKRVDAGKSHRLAFALLHAARHRKHALQERSEEHTSELQSLMRSSYAVFCLKKKNKYCSKNDE